MTASAMVRCAIYTRKSTEEGLEQEFNSLDAQREACEAYIKSQAGEGWRALPTLYDDGGYSGGNIKRPAMQRLLDDVDAGKIDVIVVYKVDRLTRSLMDFAKIVDRLNARSVSFVSITQAFNTTTSMGRLTLNVLLSFAQFEREVTGERIRDKVAASKAKGMWMGGNVPLGYDVVDRKLVVNEAECALVQQVFQRYLALGSGIELMKELGKQGHRSKKWVSRKGEGKGGQPFSCGALYYLLQNRIYVGDVVHRGSAHRGEHEPIVTRDLFEHVQQLIASNRQKRRQRPVRAAECRLTGLVFAGASEPLTTSFSYGRSGRMYRYYVSPELLPASVTNMAKGLRVPAAPLERLVLATFNELLGIDACWDQIRGILRKVELWDRSIQLVLDPASLREPCEPLSSLVARLEGRFARALIVADGADLRLIHDQAPHFRGASTQRQHVESDVAVSLAAQVRRAHSLLRKCNLSPFAEDRHRSSVAPNSQRDRWLMQLGLLSPKLQKRALQGRLPSIKDVQQLPLAWADQELQLLT